MSCVCTNAIVGFVVSGVGVCVCSLSGFVVVCGDGVGVVFGLPNCDNHPRIPGLLACGVGVGVCVGVGV